MRLRVFALCCLASPTSAQSVQDMVFAPDGPCYSRTYDDAHLAAHPDQQVSLIVVRADTADMELDTTDDLLVLVDVLTRKSDSPYSGIGICTAAKSSLTCLMEGDAGGFTLTEQDGRLRLDVGPNGMSFEGATDFLTLEPDQGDDRVFLLDAGYAANPPVPRAITIPLLPPSAGPAYDLALRWFCGISPVPW